VPNGVFDADMEEVITFGLQPAIEVECFESNAALKSYAVHFGYAPWYYPEFLFGFFSPAKGIKKKHPDLKPSGEYASSFRSKMGDKPFYGGDEPGCPDLSYFGTIKNFVVAGCLPATKHLQDADLDAWYKRMQDKVPPF